MKENSIVFYSQKTNNLYIQDYKVSYMRKSNSKKIPLIALAQQATKKLKSLN